MGAVKIAVLGLGASIKLYDGGYDDVIGVNDVWQYVPVPNIVCLDRPDRFTPERLAVIVASRPQRFYSQLDDWAARADFVRIDLQPDYPKYTCQLELKALPKSLCSPFVACAVAYKLHAATEIHLYGVDLLNHPLLSPQSCDRIKTHFTNLRTALAVAGCAFHVHGNGILSSLNK